MVKKLTKKEFRIIRKSFNKENHIGIMIWHIVGKINEIIVDINKLNKKAGKP